MKTYRISQQIFQYFQQVFKQREPQTPTNKEVVGKTAYTIRTPVRMVDKKIIIRLTDKSRASGSDN